MAADWIKDILRLAMAVGLAGARAPIGGASMLTGGFAGGGIPGGGSLPPGADEFAAKQYPNEFAPDYNHMYKVVNIPGTPNFNQHGKADAATIREAGRMQTIKEHNDTLLKYIRPGMTPRQMRDALNRGAEEEKRLPQFWNESKSRRPFSVSSSAVAGIRLTPDARIEVAWASRPNQWYTFKQYEDTQKASLAAQELLQADSIGRAVMPYQRNGKLLNFKDPSSVAWWNRKNYDAAFAE